MAGTDSQVTLSPDSTGKLVDTDQLTTAAGTVQRERHRVAGAAAAELADVRVAIPGVADYALVVSERPRSFKPFNVLANTLGDNTVVAAVVGKRIKVCYFLIQNPSFTTRLNAKWRTGVSDILGPIQMDVNSNWFTMVPYPAFAAATNAGDALVLNLDTANLNIRVIGYYWDDDAT